VPRFEFIQFPAEEATFSDFRQFGGQGYIAGCFEYARYLPVKSGNQKVLVRQKVVLERFRVNRKYPYNVFHVDPPKGFRQHPTGRLGERHPPITASMPILPMSGSTTRDTWPVSTRRGDS